MNAIQLLTKIVKEFAAQGFHAEATNMIEHLNRGQFTEVHCQSVVTGIVRVISKAGSAGDIPWLTAAVGGTETGKTTASTGDVETAGKATG